MPPARTPAEISASRSKSRVKPFGRTKPMRRARAVHEETPEPEQASNKKSAFLNLPFELKLQIVEYLPTPDILNVRVLSASWAAAGTPSIFRDGFTVRPHLDDMDRLCHVVSKPDIAKGIRHIEFFAGDMAKEQLVSAVARERQRLEYVTAGQMAKVWKLVDAIFEPARFEKHCNAELLKRCLPLLPNLESLKVTSLQCPVRGMDTPFCLVWGSMEEEFDDEDEEMSHFLNVDVGIERYTSIVSSAILCKSITKLDLDSFPIDYFQLFQSNQPTTHEPLSPSLLALRPSSKLRDQLSHITSLSIAIVGSGQSRDDYLPFVGRRLAEFLSCFHNLHTLDLSYEEADDETDECLMGFEDSFYRLKYPHLHSLRISGCDSNEEDLGKFIFAHKRTLRNLHIGEAGCTPEEKSWKDILTDLREHMTLEKFELYVPEAESRIYDVNWKSVLSDGKGKIKDAKLLELYVLGKCPWPMAASNPRERGWKRKFGAEDMKLLDLGEEEMRDLLGEDWETDGSEDDYEQDDDADLDSEQEEEMDMFLAATYDAMVAPANGENPDWEDMEVD